MKLQIDCPSSYQEGCKIVFCGEAPGLDEALKQEGFTGRAGKILDRILFAGGLDRSQIGLTFVSKRVPDCSCGHGYREHFSNQKELVLCRADCGCKKFDGADGEHFKTTFWTSKPTETTVVITGKRCQTCNKTKKQHNQKNPCRLFEPITIIKTKKGKKTTRQTDELLAWYDVLKLELETVRPNVVVACGADALIALCKKSEITKYKGSILESTLVPGLKVIPIMHPSWILKKQQWQELYISGRIARDKIEPESEFSHIVKPSWAAITMPNMEQVHDWFESVGVDDWFVIDVETRKAGYLACVGLCCNF